MEDRGAKQLFEKLDNDGNHHAIEHTANLQFNDLASVLSIMQKQGHILVNILQTGCIVLEFISLEMDIDMKEHGMKEGCKGLACTLSELGKHNLVNGKMVFLISSTQRMAFMDLPMQLAIPKFFMLSRQLNIQTSEAILLLGFSRSFLDEEAQWAIGKAYAVAKLDDRVNKTIAAAKRPANAVRVVVVKVVQR
ncbi:hypothetical protein GH714_000229 [Hevea brasiliensis]|uniref:Uncharacterized protein n=1 Tax=Hevea brasiliensis TaxID=3981 RepID=A0A6A6M7W7_HEVBR|nr:hypothetical protein GH714_000229 [Hevea brasiliensis]